VVHLGNLSTVAFENEGYDGVGSKHIFPRCVADVKIVVAFESRIALTS